MGNHVQPGGTARQPQVTARAADLRPEGGVERKHPSIVFIVGGKLPNASTRLNADINKNRINICIVSTGKSKVVWCILPHA